MYFKKIANLYNLLQDTGMLKNISEAPVYSDEPTLFNYSSSLKSLSSFTDGPSYTGSGGGFSFDSRELALYKCLAESIERLSSACFKKNTLLYEEYSSIQNQAIDLRPYLETSKLKNSYFNWIKGEDLITKKQVFIPAQLIYHYYLKESKEIRLSEPITTGAAAGEDLLSATVRGLYEIIERDCFICMYLTKTKPISIDLSNLNLPFVIKVLKACSAFNLEIYLFDITNDLGINTFLSIVIDRTGLGKSVSLGLKSSHNPIEAIEGCITESFHCKPWYRNILEKIKYKIPKIDPNNISKLRTRGLYWSSVNSIKNLDFLLNIPPVKKQYPYIKITDKQKLKNTLLVLKNKGYHAYRAEITLPAFSKGNILVVKVIVPELQPLYLNENYKSIREERLVSTAFFFGQKYEKLNTVPHPFL